MKTLKRTAMWMAKEHSMYKAMALDGEADVIYNTKDEKNIFDRKRYSFVLLQQRGLRKGNVQG